MAPNSVCTNYFVALSPAEAERHLNANWTAPCCSCVCIALCWPRHAHTQRHAGKIFYTCGKYKSYFCWQFAQTIWFVVLCRLSVCLFVCLCNIYLLLSAQIREVSLFNWPIRITRQSVHTQLCS